MEGVVAAVSGRAVEETDAVDKRDILELIDNVRLRKGLLASPSSLSSS